MKVTGSMLLGMNSANYLLTTVRRQSKMLRHIQFFMNLRLYSIKHVSKQPVKYTDTINLPKTRFPNRLTAAKRKEIEERILGSSISKCYTYQQCYKKEPTFVLHDGPPYANGDLHMGHAVNKILKDICLRQHVAKGIKVNYIPGWDCHGLPIELKATSGDYKEDPLTIRKKSRQFALEAVQRQRDEFRSWGVLANWSNDKDIYLTFKPDFITNQLELFFNFYERGLAYRDLKPVYWSPSSKTALAEAELEYDANFISPSVYVRFVVNIKPSSVSNITKPLYALVWTTTPWTLPSNQAICFNSSLEYALVKLQNRDGFYLLAANLINDFENNTKIQCEVINRIKGEELSKCTYIHPINQNQKNLKFFDAAHVQDSKGTGLVHTAPAHGPDDFLISLEKKIPVISYVNEEGKYSHDAPDFLQGKSVLVDGDRLVLEKLSEDIIFSGKLSHSYPIDWRTKQPVIIRASKQWFMNTDQLKNRALNEIDNINFYPRINAEGSKKALETQVRKRPYWCISRQRVWGVPIPVFYRKDNGRVIINKKILDHICFLVKKHGNIDFWWTENLENIIPENLLHELNLQHKDIIPSSDIFDIWFDSGSTWSSVLNNDQKADLYLEGYDQFTGWFQSSLLTSIAARDFAPYKSLFVHGFTVDEKGHKMSKSLGNVIAPKDIIAKYGTDALRLWVASHATQHMSITVSDKLLQQSADSLSKIRSTLRYLNGAIGESIKTETPDIITNDASYLNRYLLSTLVDFGNEIQRSYDAYEYNRVVTQIQNFIANQISAIYINSIKDRLYCGTSSELMNIRYTLLQCYKILCKALWPLTPFMVEESWGHYNSNAAFYEETVNTITSWKNNEVENIINAALNAKRLINQASQDVNTWTLAVEIKCTNAILSLLQSLQAELHEFQTNTELCEILQVNSVKLIPFNIGNTSTEEISVRVEPLNNIALCQRCRRFSLENDDNTCIRCTNVLKTK